MSEVITVRVKADPVRIKDMQDRQAKTEDASNLTNASVEELDRLHYYDCKVSDNNDGTATVKGDVYDVTGLLSDVYKSTYSWLKMMEVVIDVK